MPNFRRISVISYIVSVKSFPGGARLQTFTKIHERGARDTRRWGCGASLAEVKKCTDFLLGMKHNFRMFFGKFIFGFGTLISKCARLELGARGNRGRV